MKEEEISIMEIDKDIKKKGEQKQTEECIVKYVTKETT